MLKQFSSIWPIDRTLSGATTPGQSEPGSNGNERVLHIPQSSSIIGTSPSYYLEIYTGHLLGEFYSSVEMQSVYSTAPADCGQYLIWIICTQLCDFNELIIIFSKWLNSSICQLDRILTGTINPKEKYTMEYVFVYTFVVPNVSLFSKQGCGIFVWTCLFICSKYCLTFLF